MVVILSQLSRCFLRGLTAEAERSQTVTDSGRGEAAVVAASPDDDNVARMLGRRRLRLRERRVEQRVERLAVYFGRGIALLVVLPRRDVDYGAGVDGARWSSRSSKPLRGGYAVPGGFDSHALPPGCRSTVPDRCEDACINA